MCGLQLMEGRAIDRSGFTHSLSALVTWGEVIKGLLRGFDKVPHLNLDHCDASKNC